MRCHKCGKTMKYAGGMKFNEYKIGGWKCACGEVYYNPEQAQKILLLNKLRKEAIRAKLGKIRSNLILRLPKDVENALDLEKGEDVLIKVEGKGFRIIPA
ncbi:AbrB/MazE/SpoVT family DNA-binding domain-containing protein [Candidatus Woesearchaeota archaeon]|nr:AbrB/MazE/SpoVT family DNA-binding domain-containing protein [Candidatus Woesearchaeota archaeon]